MVLFPGLLADDLATCRPEVNGHRTDTEPALWFNRFSGFAGWRHGPRTPAHVAQDEFARLDWVIFDNGKYRVVVPVPVQMVSGERGALGQRHGGAGQFEQERSGRDLVAIPA